MNSLTNCPARLAWTVASLLALAALAFAPTSGRADFEDPSTLHIGGSVPTTGGDPNQIGSSGLVNVYQNSTGAENLTSPWLLILGVANDSTGGHFFDSLGAFSVTSYNPYNNPTGVAGSGTLGGANLFAGNWNATTGFAGLMTASSRQDAYGTASLFQGNPNNSNSFGNWATGGPNGGDLGVNNINATNFGIYVFEITAPLNANGNVAIQFASGKIPLGTYAIAYGLGPVNSSPNGKTPVYDTPFTEAGLTTDDFNHHVVTPAPSSALLLGLGGLGLVGFVGLRRWRQATAAA
jgi:hypothetical protein